MPDLPNTPQSNAERYLSALAGEDTQLPESPQSRVEQYLAYIVENGGTGSGGSLAEELTEHLADNVRHITAAERTAWNAKAGTTPATASNNGLMSAADKKKLEGIAAGATANTGTITGITMNGASKGTSGVVDLGTVITQHQDISGKQDKLPVTGAANRGVYVSAAGVVTAMTHTLEADVPSNAVFTDTTYTTATTSADGLMSAADKGKLDGINAADAETDADTPAMNGTAAVGTSAKYARADHIHPTDTSRAAQADLESAQATITQQAAEIQRLRQLVNGIDASIYLSAGPGNPVSVSDAYAKAAPRLPLLITPPGIPARCRIRPGNRRSPNSPARQTPPRRRRRAVPVPHCPR